MSVAAAFPNVNSVTGLDGNGLVNPDNSRVAPFLLSDTRIPHMGGKVNRNRIKKISMKYKMSKMSKMSKKTVRRRIQKRKSRVRSRYSKKRSNRYRMSGGSVPNYPASHSQYMNNTVTNNVHSVAGTHLPPSLSALAMPPLIKLVPNAGNVDNYSHGQPNAFGNSGSGSGFVSRGSF